MSRGLGPSVRSLYKGDVPIEEVYTKRDPCHCIRFYLSACDAIVRYMRHQNFEADLHILEMWMTPERAMTNIRALSWFARLRFGRRTS